MIQVEVKCPACNDSARITLGQSTRAGRLAWWKSESCSSCGRATEADGYDDSPEDVREAILAKDGAWCLVARTEQEARRAMYLLRNSAAARGRLDRLGSNIVATGTSIEMTHLATLASRIALSVVKASETVEP